MAVKIKRLLSRAFLRGPLRASWTLRKFRRLEAAYCGEVVRASKLPKPAPVPVSFRTANPVRTILLICDCMWEQNELVPDLRKRWEVGLLDLHPALKTRPVSQPGPDAVAAAIRVYRAGEGAAEPDVILFYARAPLLSEEVFEEVRRRWKCPVFGMNLDDKATFFRYGVFREGDDNYQRWAGKFDLNLTNTLAAVEWYHQLGFPCIYSPQGVNLPANLPAPGPGADFKHLFSFVGSNRIDRSELIHRLRELGIPVTLFGTGWPESQWAESPTQIYRSTQINLGIGYSTATKNLTTVKGRDFECPGVGACYLTTYNWELVNHFEMGKEILCYRSLEELVEIYSYYKKRPEECLKIAQAAYRRSAAEHTWEKRFEKIFRETGFKV